MLIHRISCAITRSSYFALQTSVLIGDGKAISRRPRAQAEPVQVLASVPMHWLIKVIGTPDVNLQIWSRAKHRHAQELQIWEDVKKGIENTYPHVHDVVTWKPSGNN